MIHDNGLDSRDPDYDDYGYGDFLSDYEPDDEQLITWFEDDPEGAIQAIKKVDKLVLKEVWCDIHEHHIEQEWNDQNER